MIYVISKATFGSYNVRDIQCNANWDCCPYSEYALIPESMVDEILATQGYCDITLNDAGTEVLSYAARSIPTVQEECCGTNTVLSVNGVTANTDGAVTLTPGNIGAAPSGYGYGGEPVTLSSTAIASDEKLTEALQTVYESMNARETKLVRFYGYPSTKINGNKVEVSDYVFFGFLSKSSNDYGSFIAHSSYHKGCLISKAKVGGVWQELEWVNPPLDILTISNIDTPVEYRTTERWMGKPVYATLLKKTFDNVPSVTVSISDDPNNIWNVIDYVCKIDTGDSTRFDSALTFTPDSRDGLKTVVYPVANTSGTIYLMVKYTKP